MNEHYWPVFRQVAGRFLGRGSVVVVFKNRGTILRLSEFEMEVRTSASTLAHDLRAPKGCCLPSRVDLPQCFVHFS